MPRTNKLKIYSRISEIILGKKRKRLSREFLFCPSLLQCRSVDLDASEYTLGLIFVTSPYGTSPASKLLTSYFWPTIVVNIFFHFQIIVTESFHSKIAPPGNFIKIYQTKPWRNYYLVKSQLRQRFVRVYKIKWHWQRNNFERLRWITKDLQLPRPDRPYITIAICSCLVAVSLHLYTYVYRMFTV